jgi:hypothetical protein
MFPKWGQIMDMHFNHSPFSENNIGSIFAGETNFYFPGILRHHGISIYVGYQAQNDQDIYGYSYAGYLSYPRGYDGISDERAWSIMTNYKFPLFCPDWSIGSIFYIKRFKLDLFFDYGEGSNPGQLNVYKSTGAELTADFHFLRFIVPFDMGVRSIYFPDTGSWGWQFVYTINY